MQGLDVVKHEPVAVRRQAVSDDRQLAFDRHRERLEELHQLRALDRAIEQSEINAPEADTGDQRQVLPKLYCRGDLLPDPGRKAFPGAGPFQ